MDCSSTALISLVQVSHWGNVAFEEYVEVRHAGARLKGGFSRFEYQVGRLRKSRMIGLIELTHRSQRWLGIQERTPLGP
jgi:hypothetical protein